jgi:chemotaxis protein methyltransferase CheR
MAPGSTEPQAFRDWIARRLGLHFDDTKLGFLAEVLERRAENARLARRSYLDRLETREIEAELPALVLELTVPETYFFRHIDQFLAFADVALPRARATRETPRRLRILSAGCASGEEPYSLAMLVRERGTEVGGDIDIRGVDVNPAALAKAARGTYSSWALRETPAASCSRWFRDAGREFELEPSIRAAVTFHEVNLAQENVQLWASQEYDVIFCRNVLMYFTPGSAQSLVARMTRSLVPGGHLFLGHAETLRGLSHEYHLCHTHGTFYYQRKAAPRDRLERDWSERPEQLVTQRVRVPPAPAFGAPVLDPSWAKTWLETIEHASHRIQTLAERPTAAAARPGSVGYGSGARARTEVRRALELLKDERFTDALDVLGRLPDSSEEDPDTLLLRAALLTHSGNLRAAEHVSAQLLERDELNAGAHYLLALCRESAGDRPGAIERHQAAIYLDPGFAMPRLHLGLMARRAGDLDGARKELGQALQLLQREDSSRLLLFGGGFARDALISLCCAELRSAGGMA